MKNWSLYSCLFVVFFLMSCEKDETSQASDAKPNLACGLDWTTDCLQANWEVSKKEGANLLISFEQFNSSNSLLMVNPHDSLEFNPVKLKMTTTLKNIRSGIPYKISFDSKIKGFPDNANNAGLAAYVNGDFETGGGWYNEMYYFSETGKYHEKDWGEHSFTIIGQSEDVLNFELYSVYDTVWIANLRMEEL